MASEDEVIKGLQERSFLSEAELKENFLKNRMFKEKRAQEGAHLESIAGDDLDVLKQALSAYTEAMLPKDQNRIVERILKIAPHDPSAICAHAGALTVSFQDAGTLRHNMEVLIAEYSKLCEFADFRTLADKSIALILYDCGEYERALLYLRRLDLEDPALRDRLAHSLCETGRFQEAFELFQSFSYLDFSIENRGRCADVLEMFGKVRQARRLKFSLDRLNLAIELRETEPPEPEMIRKHTKLGGFEHEVLATLYDPRKEKKLSYEEALAELNRALRPLTLKTFSIDEIKEIEEAALNRLGASSGEEYHQIVKNYYHHVQKPRSQEHDRRLKKLLDEKYPDLLEPDPSDGED
ncbi:MAG: hypothetical protein K2X77_30120 [Candidatus Obscuribacterales bacterium]|jgi:tetratricopeptide (TPR) repeat protein|nr:hypothetical protein [Candidatus Obscuribacterales bacterium]